jgi:hypothetical protein
MKKIIEIELREKDIDNNPIDVARDLNDIVVAIARFWNVKSISVKDTKKKVKR